MLGALAVALPGVSVAAVSPANPVKKGTRLAIVELATPGTMIGLGAQVEQQLESSARELGYKVLTPPELQAKLGPEGWEQLRKCEGRVACAVARLRTVGADRVVVGTLNKDEKSYLLRLWLADLGTGEVIADVDRPILIASRRFRQDVAEAVPRLLRGEREARGTLKIVSKVKNVTVLLEGEPVGHTPLELQLKPGKYEIRLEKQAYLPVRRLVDVYANQVTTEEARLILQPGAVPEEETAPPPLAAKARGHEEPGGIRVTLPAWIAFGAAAVAGGAGAFYGVRANSTEKALRAGYDPDTRTYAGTRADALAGRQDAKTANLLYIAAGAAAATGVLFSVFDVGGEEPKVTATPAASPTGAGVFVEGRF